MEEKGSIIPTDSRVNGREYSTKEELSTTVASSSGQIVLS